MTTPPTEALLKTGEVLRRLRATASDLHRATPYMPHAHVPRRGMHLYPTSYIDAFAEFLAAHDLKLGAISARIFWDTPSAKRRAKEAKERMVRGFANADFTREQIIELLCVSPATVTDWFGAGLLKGSYQRRGFPPRRMLIITAASLRQAVEWRQPANPS